MTVTNQHKIIDNKIKANKAQYDLDRLAAKISALSSGELRKYDALTDEDLEYKASVIEQAKFDYSPLGKVFTKGLDKDDKEEGILRKLKNIESKNKKQLEAIEKNNQLKDDETKSVVLLKDGLEELIKSYPTSFITFVKNEQKQLTTKEKDIDYKKLSQEIFFDGVSFLEKYGTPYMLLKNLVANKTSMSTVNDDQKMMNDDFVFNLIKGYNASSFFKKSETRDLDNKNLYEKSKSKALDVLLNVKEVKKR